MATKKVDSNPINLSQLKEIGGVLTGEAVPREVVWKRTDEDGNEVENTFTVGVVKLGIAATERIWAQSESKSRWATLIHETIRLGNGFKDRISYEDACNLEPSLFNALSEASNVVNPAPKEGDEGKE